jgi:acylglycerol lipase
MKVITKLIVLVSAMTFSLLATTTLAHASESSQVKATQKEAQKADSLGADLHPAPCLSWIDPQSKPKIAMLCIHGLGLNSDSYTNFAKRVAHHGIAAYAIDVRGFGSWMKAKGNTQVNFDDCLGDVQATLISIRAANPGLPVYLLGESMGGAIVLRACSMYPELMDGMISSVPAGERFEQKRTDLKVALEFLKGRHKQFDIGTQIVDQATHRLPTLREDWESDPLDRMDLSAEQLIQFQSFMNDNHDAAKKISTTPVLLLQGTLDTLVKPEGTWEIFNELATKRKTFIALPSEHLVLEEGQAKPSKYDANTAEMVVGWIYGNLPDRAAWSDSSASSSATSGNTPSSGASSAATSGRTTSPSGNSGLPTSIVGSASTLVTTANASITGGAPTVLLFENSWCAECEGLDQLFAEAQKIYGTQIKVKAVDVSDPANTSLVANYKVAPIPTCVFLNSDGTVDSVLIGRCSIQNIAQGLRAIANTSGVSGSGSSADASAHGASGAQ